MGDRAHLRQADRPPEAHFELTGNAPTREFFFTPRNPGAFEVDFFLAKAFNPAQVSKTYRLGLTVRMQ